MSHTQVFDVLVIGGGPSALYELLQLENSPHRVAVVSETFGGCLDMLGDQYLQSYLPELMIKGAPSALQDYMASKTAVSPTGEEYTNYIRDCFDKIAVEKINSRVISIEQQDGLFIVNLSKSSNFGRLLAKEIILATGIRPKPPDSRIPRQHWTTCFQVYKDIVSERLEQYAGKEVCIVGGGNTAYQLASCLSRVAKDITLLMNRYVGNYPLECSDRFALRVLSQQTIELAVKSSAPVKPIGSLNSMSTTLLASIWLHAYRDLSYDPDTNSISAVIPLKFNDHPILASSLLAAKEAERIELATTEAYTWHRPLQNMVLISAIGVVANVPELPYLDFDFVDTTTGFVHHDQGRTKIDGLYVTGSAAGYPSVNTMEPAKISWLEKLSK